MNQMIKALVFLMCFTLMGCNAQEKGAAPTAQPPVAQPHKAATTQEEFDNRKLGLTIYGYNYTDTEIGSFEVNGRGGGNVMVSGPTSSGGSGVCCFTLYASLADINLKTKVKWTRDGDTWCEQEVPLKGPYPAKAEYLEVHFYQDGHIELAVTEQASEPRIKLNYFHDNSRHKNPKQNVINDGKFGVCKRGYN
jgi:Protein of unknown function (DUF3304)